MSGSNESFKISDALSYCDEIVKNLLYCPFGGVYGSGIFEEEAIKELKGLAVEIEAGRRRKNWGVAGGSVAGIVGGGMSIVGAALLPFTFGTSVGLIATGTAVGLGASGVVLGFSIDKIRKDKKKVEKVKPALEKFIEFQKNLATSVVIIRLSEKMIRRLKEAGLTELSMRKPMQMRNLFTKISDDVRKLYGLEYGDSRLDVKLSDIKHYALKLKDLVKEIIAPLKSVFADNANCWFDEEIQNAEKSPFNMLASLASSNDINNSNCNAGPTLSSFVARYLQINADINDNPSRLPSGIGVDAAGNFVAQGGVVGARVVLRAFDVSDNLARVGGNVLRVAQAVSAAGIVLSSLGVVVDIAFLGHALYDLKKKDADELSQAFTAIAAVMEDINKISL